jgi:hypothetical protein
VQDNTDNTCDVSSATSARKFETCQISTNFIVYMLNGGSVTCQQGLAPKEERCDAAIGDMIQELCDFGSNPPTNHRTPSPTSDQPSAKPSHAPTLTPTAEQPSTSPTDFPTAAPTDVPTAAPTMAPTADEEDEANMVPLIAGGVAGGIFVAVVAVLYMRGCKFGSGGGDGNSSELKQTRIPTDSL